MRKIKLAYDFIIDVLDLFSTLGHFAVNIGNINPGEVSPVFNTREKTN
jgi:hypothetical protein